MTLVSFIIPVRHPDNAPDWPSLKLRLSETMRSVSGQLCDKWEALIVANDEAELPALPSSRWSVVRVSFPPNPSYDLGVDREAAYNAVRLDKGRRVLSGALCSSGRYIMVVDDDDFISNRIVGLVDGAFGASGWRIDEGFLWSDGTSMLYRDKAFSKVCGTSHIIRRDLYSLPQSLDQPDNEYLEKMLGSHVYIDSILKEQGAPLQALPFAGAVYRVGHRGAHSKSRRVIRSRLFNRSNVLKPYKLISEVKKLKRIDDGIRDEFGM